VALFRNDFALSCGLDAYAQKNEFWDAGFGERRKSSRMVCPFRLAKCESTGALIENWGE